jgi:hypothetical protein
MALPFRSGIRLRHAPQEIVARLRERGEERGYLPLATERASPLLLLPCRSTLGVRMDEHAGRPVRANAAEALLGGSRPGDGGEVLGHPPLKSNPRARGESVGRDVPILRPVVHRDQYLESVNRLRPTASRRRTATDSGRDKGALGRTSAGRLGRSPGARSVSVSDLSTWQRNTGGQLRTLLARLG